MSIRFRASAAAMILLTLIAACGQAELSTTPIPTTATLSGAEPTSPKIVDVDVFQLGRIVIRRSVIIFIVIIVEAKGTGYGAAQVARTAQRAGLVIVAVWCTVG